jgi:O-antigen ligase
VALLDPAIRSPALSRRLAAVRTPLLVALVAGLAASISLAQVSLVALGAWLILARRAGLTGPLRLPLLGPLAAFAGWTVVAALASGRPLDSLLTARSVLTLAALWVVANAVPPGGVRAFATGLFLAVSVVAALAVVQVTACPWLETFGRPPVVGRFVVKCARAHGFYSIYMTLAGVLTLVLVAALPRLARLERDARWGWPAWLVGLAALALTYVRGAWLAFAAGTLGAALALGRHRLLVLAVAAAGMLALAAVPGVHSRLSGLGNLRDDTTRDRLAMLDAGVRLVRAHPLTGIGPGQLRHLYPEVASPEAMRQATSHLHNTPLQIAVERGLPGWVAWLAIFVTFFARAAAVMRRLPAAAPARPVALGSLVAIGAFLISGLFEYNFGDTEVLLVALTLMALPFAADPDRDRAPGAAAALTATRDAPRGRSG